MLLKSGTRQEPTITIRGGGVRIKIVWESIDMVLHVARILTRYGPRGRVCIVSGGARFCDVVLPPQRGDYPTTTNCTDPPIEAQISLKSEPGPSPPKVWLQKPVWGAGGSG